MTRILPLPIAVMIALATPAHSQIDPVFSIEPSIRYGFGETEYILDAMGIHPDDGNVWHLKSQLEFPLDGAYAGLDFGVLWNPASPKPWDSRISVATNIVDPGGDMTDRDWTTHWETGGAVFYDPTFPEVSSTISSAEGRSLTLATEIGKVIIVGRQFGLRLFGGYRYQHIDQDVIGLSGWQLFNDEGELVQGYFDSESFDGVTVIEYDVTFHTPNAGLEVFSPISPNVYLSGRAAYAPVFASDRDDHVLRNLESEASISGHGFMGAANLDFLLGRGANSQTFVSLTGDLLYFSASGTGFQRFYDDQPGTPEDETGDYAGGVPHEINSMQGSVGVQFGVRF